MQESNGTGDVALRLAADYFKRGKRIGLNLPEPAAVRSKAKRFEVRWIVLLLPVVGIAAYRIGLTVWGNWQLQAAQTAISAHDWPRAHRSLANAFWIWPDLPDAHLWAARSARLEGRLAEARQHLERCQGDGALRESVNLENRLLAVHAGNLRDADDLRSYMEGYPDSLEAAQIAESLMAGSLATNQRAVALSVMEWWEQHRTSRSERIVGLLWRAEIPMADDHYEEARALCRQAIELDPASWPARLMLTQLLVHDAPNEAQSHLVILLSREPDDPQLLIQQALIDRNLGRVERARESLDRVLAQRPEWVAALVERGSIELDLRNPEAAASWLDRAEELAPGGKAVMLARIEYLRQTGQSGAVEHYQRQMQRMEMQQHSGRSGLDRPP